MLMRLSVHIHMYREATLIKAEPRDHLNTMHYGAADTISPDKCLTATSL